jgi:pseudaminic acid cytidylyltransferase
METSPMNSRIAVIPARGGSKRLPGKNIRMMEGIPLIGRTISLLLESNFFDEVFVTTDNQEIARISKEFGATTPFLRDKNLSDDFTPTQPVISNFLYELSSKLAIDPEFCCCVYSSAFMLPKNIFSETFDLLNAKSDCDYVATIHKYSHPIQRAMTLDKTTHTVTFLNPENLTTRTQDLEETYFDAGQLYWGRSEAWKELRPIFNNTTAGYSLELNSVVDLDTQDDWLKAEELLKVRNFQK